MYSIWIILLAFPIISGETCLDERVRILRQIQGERLEDSKARGRNLFGECGKFKVIILQKNQ